MKLSTRAKYGIHAMIDLACYLGQGPQPIKAIAERQDIPEQYLEQLIAVLRREGLVTSVRGAQGGYLLAKPADSITLSELMHALEGPIHFSDCINDDDFCHKACACPTKRVWERISQGIDEVLSTTTLADMLSDSQRPVNEEGTQTDGEERT